MNLFQADLSEGLYLEFGNKYDNICVSPASIYMALALAVECSDLNTRAELLSALGMTYDEVKTYTKKLYSQLNNEYTTRGALDQKKVKALELLTNSIWFEETIELKEVGLNNLANDYNCSSFSAPFSKNNKAANRAVRDFISKNTKGLIDRDFGLNVDTLIALINTSSNPLLKIPNSIIIMKNRKKARKKALLSRFLLKNAQFWCEGWDLNPHG